MTASALVYADGVIDICQNEQVIITLYPDADILNLHEIDLSDISAVDLASEVSAYDPETIADQGNITAYSFAYAGGQGGNAVLFRPSRIGICMGGDSEWVDRRSPSHDDLDDVLHAIMSLSADEDSAEALLLVNGWIITRWHRAGANTAAGYARVVDIEPVNGGEQG